MSAFWKRKLAAYLHDPPHKPRAIASHEDLRQSLLNHLGLESDALRDFDRSNDWQAAAADRLYLPNPGKSGLRVDWEMNDFEFRHPLGGGSLTPRRFPVTTAGMEEAFVSALDGIAPETDDWKLKFIRAWRLWPERSAREKAGHLAYLVADTRIPDHTLWHHNALAAAFTGSEGKPAFLLFQIGPVQEFITQARSTQDLWSASYLLSFLVSQAMLAVAEEIGPDAIVFPQMRGMPLADFHWWKKGYLRDQKLRASHVSELLTPNLPNRFLALIPASRGDELASTAAAAVRRTWNDIAGKVRNFVDAKIGGVCQGWDKHWSSQVDRFPVIDWVVHPWTDTPTALLNAEKGTPPLHNGWKIHPLHHVHRWAEDFIPKGHQESFRPDSNPGFSWALHFAVTDWKFAARKTARSFSAWQQVGQNELDGVPKDHLDGKSEVLGGVEHERFWEILRKKCPTQFKGSQLYGALSVIKRLWADEYLKEALDLNRAKPVFQPVDEIAQIEEAIGADADDSEIYYAVLAMDGDNMGQWVSGTMAAPLLNSLALKAQDYFRTHWPKDDKNLPSAENVLRPLSPGYHAALSEALANFSLYCAGPIVRHFHGQIIYAGGDDVLAMLPATKALDCAQALQLAFRGIHPGDQDARASEAVKLVMLDLFDYSRHTDGFVSLRKSDRADVGRGEHLKPNWPLMVMGPKATVSAGIAIGHVHAPMQETIQAARDAEKAAKSVENKGAFCLSVLKRSGEAVRFTARWGNGVIAVWGELDAKIHNLSGKFAHRYAELAKAIVIVGGGEAGCRYADAWDSELVESLEAELRYALRQQGDYEADKAREISAHWIAALIPALAPRDFLHFWLTWAFVNRLAKPSIAKLS